MSTRLHPVDAVWFERQYAEAQQLARDSDIVDVTPVFGTPPMVYEVTFNARTLVSRQGRVLEQLGFVAGISFPSDYRRRVLDISQILAVLWPRDVWHPNVRGQRVCVGRLPPSTGLAGIIQQIYEILTFRRYAPQDPLNADAGAWARANVARFPVDPRPLRRRRLDLQVVPSAEAAQS